MLASGWGLRSSFLLIQHRSLCCNQAASIAQTFATAADRSEAEVSTLWQNSRVEQAPKGLP